MNVVKLNTISLNTSPLNAIGEVKMGGASGGGGPAPIEKPIGVFIYTTDGEFITSDNWDTANNDKAVGVFVNDGEHDFVIAKEDASSESLQWGGSILVTSIPAISSTDSAKLDFNGQDNTSNIIQELDGYIDGLGIEGAPACEACDKYTFPNGTKGYLPALGELNLAYLNKEEIDNALSKCGNVIISKSYVYHWSSTQANSRFSWRFLWRNGSVDDNDKAYVGPVRAFCKI